jgi:hypothetical protein
MQGLEGRYQIDTFYDVGQMISLGACVIPPAVSYENGWLSNKTEGAGSEISDRVPPESEGTAQKADAFRGMDAEQVPFGEGFGKVHNGFYGVAKAVRGFITDYLDKFYSGKKLSLPGTAWAGPFLYCWLKCCVAINDMRRIFCSTPTAAHVQATTILTPGAP